MPQILLRSAPPAKHLVYVDVNEGPREHQFLVAVLQGLVNRSQPRIYLRDDRYEGGQDKPLHANIQDWWRRDLEQRGHRFEVARDVFSLVHRFRSAFRGALVYEAECWSDPERANNLNVIAALCGVEDLLPVTAALNQVLRLPVQRNVCGLWSGAITAYRWALREPALRRGASRRLLAHSHPWSLFLMDYIVQNRALVVWMTKAAFGTDDGRRLCSELMTFAAANSPILGAWQSWWPKSPLGSAVEGLDELSVVKFASDHGRFFIPIVSGANLSVHSGIQPPRSFKQKPSPLPQRALDPGKVYLTFLLSDGDNVSGFMLLRPLLWRDPARGRIPIGWNFGPAMAELCPNVLDWFYRTATPNDYFVTACSGLGYVLAGYGSKAPEGAAAALLDGYLKRTARAMEATDSREAWLWWMNETTLKRFASGIPVLRGLFLEAEPRADEYSASFHSFPGVSSRQQVPAFHNFGSAGSTLAPSDELEKWRKAVTDRVGDRRPAFVTLGFNGLQTTPSRLEALLKRLGPDYMAVRPDEFIRLYRLYRETTDPAVPSRERQRRDPHTL